MGRATPRDRLAAIAGAATAEFGRLGYRGTRTSDIAAKAGMSSGSIFNYVESKEALFHLVFAYGFGHFAEALPPLPLATPRFDETVQLIGQGLRSTPAPELRAALKETDPPDVGRELRAIVAERYEVQERLWPILAVIERCAVELPDLEAFYYQRTRVSYFQQLTRYLHVRADKGYLRAMPDPAVAARLVSETVSWFAWHRHEGRDADLYDDDTVRRTVMEFVCAALLPL